MPYTTVVSGTPITASWANANVRDQVVTPFATQAARTAAIVAPVEGMVTYIGSDKTLWAYDGAAWKPYAGPPTAYKTSPETVNNNSAFQNDNDLFVPVDANAYYTGEIWLSFTSSAAAGFKLDFTAPVGTTLEASGFLVVVSGSVTYAATSALGSVTGIVSTGAAVPYLGKFTLVTGANSGTLQFRWAQHVATVSNTTVNTGSYLRLSRTG